MKTDLVIPQWHFRQAVQNKPDYRLAHFHLGRILVNQDKLAEAIEHFQKTLTPTDDQTPMFTYALARLIRGLATTQKQFNFYARR